MIANFKVYLLYLPLIHIEITTQINKINPRICLTICSPWQSVFFLTMLVFHKWRGKWMSHNKTNKELIKLLSQADKKKKVYFKSQINI